MDLQWVAVRVESNKLKNTAVALSRCPQCMRACIASHQLARQYALVSQSSVQPATISQRVNKQVSNHHRDGWLSTANPP